MQALGEDKTLNGRNNFRDLLHHSPRFSEPEISSEIMSNIAVLYISVVCIPPSPPLSKVIWFKFVVQYSTQIRQIYSIWKYFICNFCACVCKNVSICKGYLDEKYGHGFREQEYYWFWVSKLGYLANNPMHSIVSQPQETHSFHLCSVLRVSNPILFWVWFLVLEWTQAWNNRLSCLLQEIEIQV